MKKRTLDKLTISYKIFNETYYHLFDKLNKSENTIFENMDYRPPVDNLYKEFLNSSEYDTFLEAENRNIKTKIVVKWIYEHLFLETYYDVKYKLITENEKLPYNIDYKLENSFDVICEGKYSAVASAILGGIGISTAVFSGGILAPVAGAALLLLTSILVLSDSDKKKIIGGFETAGKVLGKILTVDLNKLGLGTKKEILATLDAKKIADMFDECIQIVGWNPGESNKLTRLKDKLLNNHKEYDYARCVGTKIIKFYVSLLETLYKIMKASDVDDKVINIYENGLNRGLLNEALFRNLARLTRDKNMYKLLDVTNKISATVQKIIEAFNGSKDSEYVRIGHDLSKQLDSELRNLAYKISKEKYTRPAMNRRDKDFFKENSNNSRDNRNLNNSHDNRNLNNSRDNRNLNNSRDNRNLNNSRDNRNPF